MRVLQLSHVRSEPGYLPSLVTSDREVQNAYSYVFMDAFFLFGFFRVKGLYSILGFILYY